MCKVVTRVRPLGLSCGSVCTVWVAAVEIGRGDEDLLFLVLMGMAGLTLGLFSLHVSNLVNPRRSGIQLRLV